MAIPNDAHPITNSVKESRMIFIGYQKLRGKEYGQIAFADGNGLGGVRSKVLPWEEAEALFKLLEKKISSTVLTR